MSRRSLLPDELVIWLRGIPQAEFRERMLRSLLRRAAEARLSIDPQNLGPGSAALDEQYFTLRESGKEAESMEYFRQARLLDTLRLLQAGADEDALYEFTHSLPDVTGAAVIGELGSA